MKKPIFYLFIFIVQFLFAQEEKDRRVKNFPIPVFTDSNLSLIILGSAWDKSPNPGDEISIIDENWNIFGISVALPGNNGFPIWGDNPKLL